MGAQATLNRRPAPSDTELRLWIEMLEIQAASARVSGRRLDGIAPGRNEKCRQLADCFDDLAAFLRDLL